MSVLIKGMEMPKSCYECAFCLWDEYDDDDTFTCLATDGEFGTARKNERQDFCPLVEIPPHGRLIDADALMRDIQEHDYLVRDEYNSIGNGMFTEGIRYAITEVAPTIIEAEVKE